MLFGDTNPLFHVTSIEENVSTVFYWLAAMQVVWAKAASRVCRGMLAPPHAQKLTPSIFLTIRKVNSLHFFLTTRKS